MVKTLYLADLDGTLLNPNAELSQYTKDTLCRMITDGLYLSVATARTAETALKILEGIQWSVPLVFMNGVLVFDHVNKQYVHVLNLEAETVRKVISVLQEQNVTGLMYQLVNNVQLTYYESLDRKPLKDFVEGRVVRYNKVFHQANSFSEVSPENTIYFTLLDTHDKIKPVYDALSTVPGISRSLYSDIYSSDLWYLEIHHEKASKQNAVIYLRDTYEFESIIGFGDNLNDLPMFAACDIKVAVGNAMPEVKAAADFICDTNDNDGVAKWLEERILNES